MSYFLITYHWRHLTRPQLADFRCPVTDLEQLKKQKSSGYFHAEAATVGTEDAVAAFQTPSLIASGAEASQVSILSAFLNLPMAFLYLSVPSIIRKAGSRKKAVLFLTIVDALTWLPLIAVLLCIGPITPYWLIVLWVVNLIPGILLLPARDAWLADIVPANAIGRHLGYQRHSHGSYYLLALRLFDRIQLTFAVRYYSLT